MRPRTYLTGLSILVASAWVLGSAREAAAFTLPPTIFAGDWQVLPNTPDQTLDAQSGLPIEVKLSRGGGITGVNLAMTIGDGLTGPVFGGSVPDVIGEGTVFYGNNVGQIDAYGPGVGYAYVSTTVDSGTVPGVGTLAYLSIDTTGFNSGSWPLFLSENVVSMNDTTIPPYNPPDLSLGVGSITIVPEPSTVALLVIGLVGLLGYGWRRGQGGTPMFENSWFRPFIKEKPQILNDKRLRFACLAILMVAVVCLFGSNTVKAAQLSEVIFRVEASNEDGTGFWELVDPEPVFVDGRFFWSLPGAAPIVAKPGDNNVIAVVESANVFAIADPVLALNFAVSAGASPTTFTISSPLLSFPAISQTQARASATITTTDIAGDGASYTGGYVAGTKSYQANYNGLIPGGTLFANLIGNGSTGTAYGSVVGIEDFPLGGGFTGLPSVSSMSTQYKFTVGAGDSASGTSAFVVGIPEPASLVLLGLGSVLLVGQRQRRRSTASALCVCPLATIDSIGIALAGYLHTMFDRTLRTPVFAEKRKEGRIKTPILVLTLSVAIVAWVSASAVALPITFVHTGSSGTGTIGGSPFSNAAFTFTSLGDTANRQSYSNGFFVVHDTASITIDGVGEFEILTETGTFVVDYGMVGFSRWPDLYNGPTNTAFSAWDMTTSIGPIAGEIGLIEWEKEPHVNTDAGLLFFDSATTAGTFQATVVPEPSTVALLVVGLVGLLGYGWRGGRNMFRRVLCGLALVAMMGTVAFGNPVITVTNAVTTANEGSGTPNEYSPAPSTPIHKGQTYTLYFFADGLDTATTLNGGGSTTLASFGFHMEESGDSLSFSAPEIRFNETEIVGFGWLPRTGFAGNFEDLSLSPDIDGDEDWGWSVFSGTAAAVGGGTQFLGTLEVAIADDPLHNEPSDFFLDLEPARAYAPADTSMTQTLIESPGAQPGDVVSNVQWAGLAKTNLIPEPSALALMFWGSLLLIPLSATGRPFQQRMGRLMMQKFVLLLAIALLAMAGTVQAAAYQDAVLTLNPTFYYELNETDTAGGAVDTMGNAAPGVYNGSYGPGLAEVGFPGPLEVNGPIPVPGVGGASNVSHFSNNQGHINLGNAADFGANAMTVAMFVKAGPSQGGDRLFTNNSTDGAISFQLTVGQTEGLVVGINPNGGGVNYAKTLLVPDNSGNDRGLNSTTDWWHIVASTSGTTGPDRYNNIQVWVNGVDRTGNMAASSGAWKVDTGIAKIGGLRASGSDSTTHSGAQDEVSIWLDRVLTGDQVASLWQAAQVPEPAGLTLVLVAGVALAAMRRRP